VGVGFDDPIAVLGHELDHSPAIAWLKDLDGRYVYVNRRYAAALRVLPDRLVGRRDSELTRAEIIDGAPFAAGGAADDPLQLEYTVGPFDGRPALTVLRFVVRDDAGEPIGVCGLASPVGEAHVARSECARLMRAQDPSRVPSAADADRTPPLRPQWSARAQRDLTAALAAANDWQTGLRDATRVLGLRGGWDVVTVWVPDDHRPVLRCLSMWTAHAHLREFEVITWQSRIPLAGTQLGRALFSAGAKALTEIGDDGDDRLRAASAREMCTALLVPMRDGRSTIAALELLSRSPDPLDEELGIAVESVALQLAHYRRLLQQTASPLWRFGRF
jgi:hypothetical protein